MQTDSKKYSIGLRVWVKEETQGSFLGIGRIQLLENIKKTGSITQGAANMKMSYRQAWQMVQEINTISKEPLVEKILGGKGGGGAKLTDAGEKAIKLFYKLEDKMNLYAEKLTKELKF